MAEDLFDSSLAVVKFAFNDVQREFAAKIWRCTIFLVPTIHCLIFFQS
jgi:hypothetical protein